MSEISGLTEDTPKRGGKRGLLLGGVLALAAVPVGYFAVASGVLPLSGGPAPGGVLEVGAPVSFVPIDPMIISLGRSGESRHLRFQAQLEAAPEHAAEVQALMPRVVDMLNGYLRAVDIRELEDPAALIRLRAQLLRRVQIVTGEGRVRDLLIMEFVLS